MGASRKEKKNEQLGGFSFYSCVCFCKTKQHFIFFLRPTTERPRGQQRGLFEGRGFCSREGAMRHERVECLMCLTFLRVCIRGGRAVNHEAVEELALKQTYLPHRLMSVKGKHCQTVLFQRAGFPKKPQKIPTRIV